jgi:hypothetical protein
MAATLAQAPPLPTPGAEHKLLAADAGTWDAVIEMHAEPGKPPMKSKGVEVATVGCGGLCLVSDFKGDMMGSPFHGHGVMTWDPAKKKYTGIWMDSMSFGISTMESTHDAKAKRWDATMTGPDHTGAMMTMRSVTEMPTPTTRVFTLYGPGPDGKEMAMMKITYTRRK